MGFRLGRIAPVEHLMLLKLAQPERDLNVRMAVMPAGLEQQDRCALIFG
jgi:hypothetical protein